MEVIYSLKTPEGRKVHLRNWQIENMKKENPNFSMEELLKQMDKEMAETEARIKYLLERPAKNGVSFNTKK